jgi:hypothetical protein
LKRTGNHVYKPTTGMKKLRQPLLLLFVCCYASIAFSQNVAINTTGIKADSSSILDVSSSLKGMLLPRMNTAGVNSIIKPAKGLLVYDSSKNQLMVNRGTTTVPDWQTIVSGGGWALSGNANTNPAINFIGTTDDAPLRFVVNNERVGYLDSYNISFGRNALFRNEEFNNIAIGRDVMFNNQHGYSNVAIGARTLQANIYASNIIAIGDSALLRNGSSLSTFDDAIHNMAVGSKALMNNVRGHSNTAFGYNSLFGNVDGNSNIAIGEQSLYHNASDNNISIGSFSQYWVNGYQNVSVGDSALYYNIYGNGNTAIGFRAANGNSYPSFSTFIGANTSAIGDVGNATAIGYGAVASLSNSVQLGDSNVTLVNTYGDITVKNGKGLIRSVDGLQRKVLSLPISVSTTIAAGATIFFPFSFPERFENGNIPDAYVGNIISTGGNYAGVILYVTSISDTGGAVAVYNSRASSFTVDFIVKIIAIGGTQ